MELLRVISQLTSISSFILTTICIAVHYIIPKMRKNPGNFVLIHAHLQMVLDIHWSLYTVFTNAYPFGLSCPILGGFSSMIVVLDTFYLFVISIEVYLQAKHQLISAHHKRTKIYYISSVFIAICFLLVNILAGKSGRNSVGPCNYVNDTPLDDLWSGYTVCLVAGNWYVTIVSLINIKSIHSKFILQYLVMNIGLNIAEMFIIIINVLPIFQGDVANEISTIIVSSLGGFTAICRLWNKQLIRDIQWKLFPKGMQFLKKSTENNSRLLLNESFLIYQEPLCLADYLEKNKISVRYT